jgi:uncharacterized protein (DUF3820 family)
MKFKSMKYQSVVMPFGKYKGKKIYDIVKIKDVNGLESGKAYLTWVNENITITNELLEETIVFYINLEDN